MPINREGFLIYNNQLDAFELYHLVQEESHAHRSRRNGGPILPALGHALSGAIATALSKSATYPIEIITCRLQVQSQMKSKSEAPSAGKNADAEYKSVIDAARKIYANEGGLTPFYTGCAADVTKGFIDSFLFFLAYTALRNFLTARAGNKTLPVSREIGVGVVAGCFSKAITSPIQNIVTRLQTAALYAARDPTSSSSKPTIKQIASQIHSERGLAGFWAGYSAAVILTLNPAITFTADNFLHQLLPKRFRENPSPTLTFLMAAFSKVIATAVTYPIMLAKSRAQAAHGKKSPAASGTASPNATNLIHTLLSPLRAQALIFQSLFAVYRLEGFTGLYAGLEGEVVKGFLQHGLTMVLKDNVHGGVIHTYYLLLKMLDRFPVPDAVNEASKIASEAGQEVVDNAQAVGATISEGAKKLVGSSE